MSTVVSVLPKSLDGEAWFGRSPTRGEKTGRAAQSLQLGLASLCAIMSVCWFIRLFVS